MLIIPAIDLKGGACVRLRQGDMGESKVYDRDPVAVARRWEKEGARRLHVVDLDGAVSGTARHINLICEMIAACPGLEVQVGGGIRTVDTVKEYFIAGARRVVLGTRAIRAPEFTRRLCQDFPGRIIVGLDVRQGRPALEGWTQRSSDDVMQLAQEFAQMGVAALIYTDIDHDGMMDGLNIADTANLAEAVAVPVFASGGLRSLEDVRALCTAGSIAGVIAGRSLYEGTLDLGAALHLAAGENA